PDVVIRELYDDALLIHEATPAISDTIPVIPNAVPAIPESGVPTVEKDLPSIPKRPAMPPTPFTPFSPTTQDPLSSILRRQLFPAPAPVFPNQPLPSLDRTPLRQRINYLEHLSPDAPFRQTLLNSIERSKQ